MPRRIVDRDAPVARYTAAIPPRPHDFASVANARRRSRSFNRGNKPARRAFIASNASSAGTATEYYAATVLSVRHAQYRTAIHIHSIGLVITLQLLSDGAKYESEILKAAGALPLEVQTAFFDAVAPDNISTSIEWVTQSLSDSAARSGRVDQAIMLAREKLRSAPNPRYHEPWRVGWHQAAIVREAFGLGSGDRFALDQFVMSSLRPLQERRIKAAGTAGESPSSLIVVGSPNAMRFTLARAFWHMVATDSRSFLVTSSHTESQKIERAFAAELLAPARGIADSLGPLDSVEDEDLEEVADSYDVATTVVEHQVRNQLIG